MNTCLLLIIINRMIHVALKQLPVVQLLKSTVIFLCGGKITENSVVFIELWKPGNWSFSALKKRRAVF